MIFNARFYQENHVTVSRLTVQLKARSKKYQHGQSLFTSIDQCENFVWECPPNQTPTQKLISEFSIFGSQLSLVSSLVSFQMIFKALQSELFRFKFHSMRLNGLPTFQFSTPKKQRYRSQIDEQVTVLNQVEYGEFDEHISFFIFWCLVFLRTKDFLYQ